MAKRVKHRKYLSTKQLSLRNLLIFSFLLSAIIYLNNGKAQSYFNIIPNVGGIDSQGVCRVAIVDSTKFFVFGHKFDTSIVNTNVHPWLGEFDYDGNILQISPLSDSLYDEPFYPNHILYDKKENTRYYLYVHRFLGGANYTPYIIEIDLENLSVVKSSLIENSVFSAYINGLSAIKYQNGIINLVNYVIFNDSTFVFLTQLDTAFNKIREVKIPNITQEFYPFYFDIDSNNTVLLLGDGIIKNDLEQYKTHILLSYNINTDSLYYKTPPTNNRYAFSLSHTKTIYRDSNGTWVIAARNFIDRSDNCFDCFQTIPYVYSVDSSFNNLLWETRFYDIPETIGNNYEIYSMIHGGRNFYVAGNYRDNGLNYFPNSGIVLSVNNIGDSLWMRHFVPLNWENERVLWAKLRYIQYTSFNSLITVGEVADNDLKIIRPWIMHLDSQGCLMPGCNILSDFDNESKEICVSEVFKVYPNPAGNELYLLGLMDFESQLKIKVVSLTGKVIKQASLTANKGFQYILFLENIPSGLYNLIITDTSGHHLQSNVISHF